MLTITRRAALFGLPLLPTAARAAEPSEINFGIVSTEGASVLKSQWTPFLEDMQKAVGVKVNGFYPSDYAGVIEAMRFDKVQVAWYGNASAIQAVDRADGEVFAQKTYADGSKGYYSLLIVNKDSPYQSLPDLLKAPPGTLNFGNGDPNSTSGFLIPSYYAWAKNNVDIRKFFKNVVSSNHETNLLAVANKQVDVATNNTEDFEKFAKSQPARAANIRPIWKSPIIPADPIVWRRDLPAGAEGEGARVLPRLRHRPAGRRRRAREEGAGRPRRLGQLHRQQQCAAAAGAPGGRVQGQAGARGQHHPVGGREGEEDRRDRRPPEGAGRGDGQGRQLTAAAMSDAGGRGEPSVARRRSRIPRAGPGIAAAAGLCRRAAGAGLVL